MNGLTPTTLTVHALFLDPAGNEPFATTPIQADPAEGLHAKKYYARYNGQFHEVLDLTLYPFDRQVFTHNSALQLQTACITWLA